MVEEGRHRAPATDAGPSPECVAHAADNARRKEFLAKSGRWRVRVRKDTVSIPVSASTRNESALLVGSMILAPTRSLNTSSPPAARPRPSTS